MPRCRSIFAFALVLVLTSSLAMAAPRPEAGQSWGKATAAAAAFSDALGARLWGWLTAAWTKVGCGSDPNGACSGSQGGTPVAPGDLSDVGCGIDPSGSPCAGGS
jgi:hypothetical protein